MRTVLIGAALLALAGCASMAPASDFCLIYKPIILSDPEIAALGRAAKDAIAVNNQNYLDQCRS